MYRPNDVIYHRHDGGAEEENASATVFPGGFRCWVCRKSYGVPRTSAREEPYDFEEVVVEENDAQRKLPKLDWRRWMQRKFFVLHSPMGTGKTEQLMYLVDRAIGKEWSLLVPSFRRMLATQQAHRFAVECYLKLPPEVLKNEPPNHLVICVNSLDLIGERSYDIVILDEVGLIRRHFLSSTCQKVLSKVYDRFCRFIREAKFVAMCQDGVSREDVQFVTDICGVDADDRARVGSYSFNCPIEIHPIQYTTKWEDAVLTTRRCYSDGFQEGSDGHQRPFMVFCSSVIFAEFMLQLLKTDAEAIGADPARVKGIWAAVKDVIGFNQRFSEDPNSTAHEADVVICTSVIGAGFSIDQHFVAFHAYLFTGILNHTEELQFIRRLRFFLSGIPDAAVRQSYLFVQEGQGSNLEFYRVLEDFAAVRKMMIQSQADLTGSRHFVYKSLERVSCCSEVLFWKWGDAEWLLFWKCGDAEWLLFGKCGGKLCLHLRPAGMLTYWFSSDPGPSSR